MSSALTPLELTAIVIVVVLAIAVIAVLLFLLRRLKERRAKLLGELGTRPEHLPDRAFNRIAMARREADILGRQGADVSRAREQIAQAQAAFDLRNFDRSYELAQQAHEGLVHARTDRTPLPAASTSSGPAAMGSGPTVASPSPTRSASRLDPVPVPPPSASLPKNKVESQFQLRLLDQELETARRDRPDSAPTRDAEKSRHDAGAAFDRGDFTEAFRLALKGRRAIGSGVESLPASGAPVAASDGPIGNRAALDPSRAAEEAASGGHCPTCGYPALPGDAFCRGCGEPRVPTACPKCGADRQPADTFCGRCGAAFS